MEWIDKAQATLADALHAWAQYSGAGSSPDMPHERVLVLLRIAEVQAQLAQAEALGELAGCVVDGSYVQVR